MKKRIDYNNFLVLSIMALIYIIPVSTIETKINYNIYYYTRLLIVVSAIFIFFKCFKIRYSYLIFAAVFIGKFIIYGEISVNLILLACCIYLFDYLLEIDFEFEKTKKTISICSKIFFMQIVVATLIKGKIQLASFIGDNNYNGYFIFFIFVYYLYIKDKKWIFWMLLSLFTFSRATIIATTLIIILYFIQEKKDKFNGSLNIKIIKFIFWIGQLLIVPISYIFVYRFNTINYKYVYVQGFNRLSNLMDESNYLRFMVNILAIRSFNIKNLFIGLKANSFEGLNYIANKTLYPHNSILVLYIHFGIIITYIYMNRYIKIYKKCNNKRIIPIFISLLVYQAFLGPSAFYGVELLIFMIIMKQIGKHLEKEEKINNEDRHINIS